LDKRIIAKLTNLPFNNKRFFVIFCHYKCVCDISEHVSSEVIGGNFLLSHDVARTETRPHFLPMTGIIY